MVLCRGLIVAGEPQRNYASTSNDYNVNQDPVLDELLDKYFDNRPQASRHFHTKANRIENCKVAAEWIRKTNIKLKSEGQERLQRAKDQGQKSWQANEPILDVQYGGVTVEQDMYPYESVVERL